MTIRVATTNDLDEAIGQFEAAERLCIDTEFHAERRYRPRLYLVQIHVEGGDTWLLDPLVDGMLRAVAPAVTGTPWLVHAGRQDIRLLMHALGDVPETVQDTQIGAGLAGSRFPQSYGKLVAEYLGKELDKSHTLSDWSRRPLTDQQVGYAAADVQLLPALWEKIHAAVAELNRTQICDEACREARENALDRDFDTRQWRRIQAVGVLSGPSVATLEALAIWREDKARNADQPARSILSDGLMVELSKRMPTSVDALRANRRFPKGIVKRHGEVIVDIVGRASSRPAWGWPPVIRHRTAEARQLAWFRSWALIQEHSKRFAAPLVLPDSMLERIILARPDDPEKVADVLGSWRNRLCGAEVLDALQSRIALRLGGSDAVASTDDRTA